MPDDDVVTQRRSENIEAYLTNLNQYDINEQNDRLKYKFRTDYQTYMNNFLVSSKRINELFNDISKLKKENKTLKDTLQQDKNQTIKNLEDQIDDKIKEVNSLKSEMEIYKRIAKIADSMAENIGIKSLSLTATGGSAEASAQAKTMIQQTFELRKYVAEEVDKNLQTHENDLKTIFGEADFNKLKSYIQGIKQAADNDKINEIMDQNKGLLGRIKTHLKDAKPYLKKVAKIAGIIGLGMLGV